MYRFTAFLIALCAIILMDAQSAFAQFDYDFDQVRATVGRGAVSKGFDVSIFFEDSASTRLLEITGNDDRVYIKHFWKEVLMERLDLSASTGLFNNTPWAGVQANLEIVDNLTLIQWEGVSIDEAGQSEWNPQRLFTFSGAYLLIEDAGPGDLTLSWASIKFQEDPRNHLPGLSYSLAIDKKEEFDVFAGVDYDLNEEELLWRIGLSWSPDDDDDAVPPAVSGLDGAGN